MHGPDSRYLVNSGLVVIGGAFPMLEIRGIRLADDRRYPRCAREGFVRGAGAIWDALGTGNLERRYYV